MDGEIKAALDVLNQRKAAIVNGRPEYTINDDEYAALLSGFDLLPRETKRLGVSAAIHGDALIAGGNTRRSVLFSTLIDGLAMGLLIAEAREREAARA